MKKRKSTILRLLNKGARDTLLMIGTRKHQSTQIKTAMAAQWLELLIAP